MTIMLPVPERTATSPLLLTFQHPDWLVLKLRVLIRAGQPWFTGSDVLDLLSRPPETRGNIYDDMPVDHRLKLPRDKTGITGRGPKRAVLVSLPGVLRLIRLQRACERRKGIMDGASFSFEAILRADILPDLEKVLSVSELWKTAAEGPAPGKPETTEEKLARLAEQDQEYMDVAQYDNACGFGLNKTQRGELGRWAAEECRGADIPTREASNGVQHYPRFILARAARVFQYHKGPRYRI